MKRFVSFVISILLITSVCTVPAYASGSAVLNISKGAVSDSDNTKSFGVTLNSDNLAIDGGLSANLVKNGSFESEDNAWQFSSVECVYGTSSPISQNNPTYNIISVDGSGVVKNEGYATDGGMGFVTGEKYKFSCYLKNVDFDGTITVHLVSSGNASNAVQLSTQSVGKVNWTKVSCELTAQATETGSVAITLNGTGSIQLDNVSLVPESSYGYGTDEWKYSSLRSDLVEALKRLNPSFIKYEIAESDWSGTVGELNERIQTTSTNEFGYHEYLQLCKDFGCTAIPSVSSGNYDVTSNEFANYKQGILDLIEYANADSLTSYFGALRSINGSDDSFAVKYIQLIDGGTGFDEIKKAIESKYDDVTVLTNDDIAAFDTITEYGEGITKSNMGACVENAKSFIDTSGFATYCNGLSMLDTSDSPNLIWFDSHNVILTPNYYAQMLFANNEGDKVINATLAQDSNEQSVFDNVTIDENKEIIYIKLVNTSSSSTSVTVNLDDFDDINYASIQSISNGYKSAANKLNKQFVAPSDEEIESNSNSFEVSLKANSVNVIRVAYGSNNGDSLYQLPDDIDLTTKNYIPTAIKVVIVVLCISIPIGSVIGYLLYTKVISNKKRGKKND